MIAALTQKANRTDHETYAKALDLKRDATIHSCRDTYATQRLQDGLSLGEVSQLLGHASIAQTMKYASMTRPTR